MNELEPFLAAVHDAPGPIAFLTGAGISAESGIPTFRGPEGYWRVGSLNYRSEQLATFEAFGKMPESIWAWYLYRRSVCRSAHPNTAHEALARLERHAPERFHLVTQNVDGLHRRAGNSREKTYEIHGNIDFVRCSRSCMGPEWVVPMPSEIPKDWGKDQELDKLSAGLLHCDNCASWLRPHVLWFDECYDEPRFRIDSSLDLALGCAGLVVIGTSGATTLPAHMVETIARRRAPLLVIGTESSPFHQTAEASPSGTAVIGRAGTHVPALVDAIIAG